MWMLTYMWSVVKLVNLDLYLFELLEKLLQVDLAERDALCRLHISRAKLLEITLLYVFTIFPSLFISLQIEGDLHERGTYVSSEDRLLTGSRVVKYCVARLTHATLL